MGTGELSHGVEIERSEIPGAAHWGLVDLKRDELGRSPQNHGIIKKRGRGMSKLGDLVQTADWKSEKHVPVIECPGDVKKGEMFDIKISLGKEVAHPNTTEHHIRWIQLFFKPENGKFLYQIGNFEFAAHGETVDGPDTGPVYTNHSVVVSMKATDCGDLVALSYCNIHGLWEYTKPLGVE